MKKKIVFAMICIVLSVGLAACGSKNADDSTREQLSKKIRDLSDKDGGPADPGVEEVLTESGTKDAPEEGGSLEENGSEETGRTDVIAGNGGHFVEYDGKVYFRIPDENAMKQSALFGEYDQLGGNASCTVAALNLQTMKTEKLFSYTSCGPMVISGGHLVLATNDMTDDDFVQVLTFDGAVVKDLPGSRIFGALPSGEYFVTGGYEDDYEQHMYICDENGSSRKVQNTMQIHAFAGLEDELYCITYKDETTPYGCFAGYDLATGEETLYGTFPEISEYSRYPGEPEYLYVEDGTVYLQMSAYEGTGHFYAGSRWFSAKCGETGSLTEITPAGTPSEDVEEGLLCPAVMLKDGRLIFTEGKPLSADVDADGDVGYYDENGEFVKCASGYGFIYHESGDVQKQTEICELVDGGIYIVRNSEVYDPDASIGWREAFMRQETRIERLDVGSGANVLIGLMGGPGFDPDAVLGSDPLQGLVADDILNPFRDANPVKDADSVYDEARILGAWVQKSIGKDRVPKNIKALGESIGQHYEFCFGTDVGNNFTDNFPHMYATYFALKDYYTSDGRKGSEYYKNLQEENEFLGTGDPERIRELYDDLQKFVTACNNLIREQL
ncbi:MAG: YgdI/YgdR family lipoprotein [Lachnospiraceae bacterium]|nr:YgdI/YgdR family lipoprotein [Lachnospiraceae bacterium]